MSDSESLLSLLRPYMDVTIVEQLNDLGQLVPRVAELLDATTDFQRYELRTLVFEHHGAIMAETLEAAMRSQVRGEVPVSIYTPV